MSFELRQDESIRKGIRRIVRKQLANARDELRDDKQSSLTKRIHSARKRLKRVRAVVRMVRSASGESAYQRENEAFRDAGRPLSAVRDAEVLIEALAELKKRSRKAAGRLPFREAGRRLATNRRRVQKQMLRQQDALKKAAAAVEDAMARLADWSDAKIGWRDIAKGIKKIYRDGRDAFDEVKQEASVAKLHEWRKQAKYLRYQLELLTPSWPKVVGDLARQAKKLGDLLGDDHDLAVLHWTLSENEEDGELAGGMKELGDLIEDRRQMLERKAIPRGELLYRDRPKQFVDRLEAYWKKWQERS